VHHDVHPHFQCSDCGKVDCLSTDVLIPTIPNRTVDVSQILLQGTCEECL
jgi:Fur family ferric uptake transcriptional regulator